MLHYILQTLAFQLFFLLVYDLLLKKETFFNWNRAYLLLSSIGSFILPFIKIRALQESIPQQLIMTLPEIVIGEESHQFTETILLDAIVITGQSFSYMQWLFYIGLSISLVLFGLKLYRISKLIYKNPKTEYRGFRVVNLIKSNAAFSFLNYIFIGENIHEQEALQILTHEKVHVQQKHTLDLLYFEILRILFWFNPLIYISQNRMAELHEFIADSKVIKQQGKKDYYQNLLAQIFDTNQVSFINTFFKKSLIKKRIMMLSKKQSKAILKLKYALLIPVVFGMLMYTSCTQESVMSNNDDTSIIEDVESLKTKILNQEHLSEEEKKQIVSLLQVAYAEASTVPKIVQHQEVDYSNAKEVPFAVIDQVPIFPGCELGTRQEQKKCMSQKIAEIVNSNFNTKLANDLNLNGKQKIYVGFKIDKQGQITDVRSRASHEELALEAKRVIDLLPQMIPGKQDGQAVVVPYSLPIVFKINE